ncbi:hypothetical protein [Parvibaculum sp.]|uniref:hypothetical protein n=1 Tax=Parvibaculum sp. TaxID=2024848 RepID=UPI00260AF1E2|nr:hypothetical protein [Parvibaculum sp.]MCW5728140.1 hypothetical protein [Parvibaculum sp.]
MRAEMQDHQSARHKRDEILAAISEAKRLQRTFTKVGDLAARGELPGLSSNYFYDLAARETEFLDTLRGALA